MTDNPQITDAVAVICPVGTSVAVYAYAQTVVIEADDRLETVGVHLPVTDARRYAAALLAACDDADRLLAG